MEIVVIEFEGGIEDFPLLIQTVDNLIADGARRLVVDLHPLPFINSAALGYLVKAAGNLEEKKGELTLARVQPAIQRILGMTQLDAVIPAFGTVAEAITYLGGDPHGPSEVVGPGIKRTKSSGGQ